MVSTVNGELEADVLLFIHGEVVAVVVVVVTLLGDEVGAKVYGVVAKTVRESIQGDFGA